MIDVDFKLRSERARKTLQELVKRTTDMRPVWKDFRTWWQDELMSKVWDSEGRPMQTKWAKLTPQYAKWKKKHGGKRLLELTGKLFRAVKGGSGWYDKIEKKSLEMGVQGEKYFYPIQHRQKNPRHYFYTKQEDIPERAYAKLIELTDTYLEEADK